MGRNSLQYQRVGDGGETNPTMEMAWMGTEGRAFLYQGIGTNALGDPFLNELVSSRPFQRLNHVGFLGAIDFLKYGNGSAPHRRRHTRYEHSVAVAALALQYADAVGLPSSERRIFGAAGLLHDIGHGPLSHTLEPVFREAFGIDHHAAGNRILMGASPWGEDLQDIFARFGVDVEAVIALLDGSYGGAHEYIFSSPINIDTIEAINRCRLFIHDWTATSPAHHTVKALAESGAFPVHEVDAFWELKDQVYVTLIHNRLGQIMDAAAQAYMRQNLSRFSDQDFYRTELTLRRREPGLFAILDAARDSKKLVSLIFPDLIEEKIFVTKRRFWIDQSEHIASRDCLHARYHQSKVVQEIEFSELLRI